jgi:hypothetical protein
MKQHFFLQLYLGNTIVFMRTLLLACLLFSCIAASAQRKNRHTPVITKGVYLSLNPYSVIEPQQGAVGLGIGYRFNKRIELHLQTEYLYRGVLADNLHDLHGFRAILSGKYFYQNKYGFFVGAELRLKQYTFVDNTTIVNEQLRDTITNFQYHPQHTLIGVAVFWGKRFKLTPNGKFELEGHIGAGGKYRRIERKGFPAGYVKQEEIFRQEFLIPNIDREIGLPYITGGIKLILHL